MTGRRWSDISGASFDSVRRVMIAAWPFVASLAAVATLVAATIVSVGAVKDRDRFVIVAANSAAAARDAKTAAARAETAAAGAKEAAATTLRLLEQNAPCTPGDPPDTPGCQRQARTEAYVAKISADLARGIAAHDLNTHEDLEELRRRVAANSPPLPPVRQIAPASAPATAPAAPPPVATPDHPPGDHLPVDPPPPPDCPRLPNGRCRK